MIYLSIVIPVRNEENFIMETLESLIQQEYPGSRFELLVVDGRSTDKTREVVKTLILQYPELSISLIDNPGQLSSCGRNIGIKASRGKLIGVIDGHVFIPNLYLFKNMDLRNMINKSNEPGKIGYFQIKLYRTETAVYPSPPYSTL